MSETTKDLSPMETFRQRVTERMRSDIGSLLPDEALNELVKKAVEEEFFKSRQVTDPHWGGYGTPRLIDKPSWFITEVAEAAEPLIKQAVSDIIREREPEILAAIKKFVSEQNLLLLAMMLIRDGYMQEITTQMATIRSINND